METYKTTAMVRRLTGSRKKTFTLSTHSSAVSTNSYWDGGSRSYYSGVNYKTHQPFSIKQDSTASYPAFIDNAHTLQPGELIVKTTVFCGKPGWPTIHCRADEIAAVKTYLEITQ